MSLEVGMLVCMGFFMGGFLWAKLATGLSKVALEQTSEPPCW